MRWGIVLLITATGNKINNNLYKMQIMTYHCNNKSPETMFLTEEPAQSWDVWHRRLRHIGFLTLQNMLDKNLVNGFHVGECTIKSDCQACVEAKQTCKPFGNNSERKTSVTTYEQ